MPLGRPLEHAWLRLFGIVPFKLDRLVVVEVQPGRRFLERSSMLSMRLWEHERTLAPVAAGTRVHDRVTFRPRLPVPSWPGRPRTPRGCRRNPIVHGDHRGHRLGQRVKAANLTALLAENPHARRVHTWNANENRWMLYAINDALGFAPIGLEGLGQKKV